MTAPEVLAIVPARGGSKGLPRKNLALLAGRPLLAWTVDAARKARGINRCIVSSDDDKILDCARACGAETLRRSVTTAGDLASSESVVAEVLAALRHYAPDIVVLLQPTSPLRSAAQIDAGLVRLGGADAVIGVCRPRHHPMKALAIGADGFLTGLYDRTSPFRPRQELPEAWQPNGALYIVRRDAFERTGFFPERTLPFAMDERSSVDIDSADDLRLAELWLAAEAQR